MSDADFWDQFGKPVPASQKAMALRHLRDIAPRLETEKATALIDHMSRCVERDAIYDAERYARRYVDLTGYLRILAVLCTPRDVAAEVASALTLLDKLEEALKLPEPQAYATIVTIVREAKP